MGALTEGDLEELQSFCSDVKRHLETHYGPIFIFEEGPARPRQASGSGIDHAHINLVPFRGNLVAGVKRMFPDYHLWREVPGFQAIKEAHREGLSYLYVEQPDHPAHMLLGPDLPSQVFRRVIAFEQGIEAQYDWRSYPFAEKAQATLKTLTG